MPTNPGRRPAVFSYRLVTREENIKLYRLSGP
jgi:hypothetical protein